MFIQAKVDSNTTQSQEKNMTKKLPTKHGAFEHDLNRLFYKICLDVPITCLKVQ